MIELNNNIFASLKKDESIMIFDIKNIENYLEIKKNQKISNILIDEKKRYLISSEDEYFVKFRDLNEIIKKFSDIIDKYCQLIKKLDIKFDNLKLVKQRDKNFICSFNKKSLNIYEIPSLIIRHEIQIQERYNSKIVYEQINNNELSIMNFSFI